MKMNFLDRLVVDPRFRFRQQRKDPRGPIFNAAGQTRVVDDFENVAEMTVRIFVRGVYSRIGRANSGTIDLFEINLPTTDAKQIQLLDQCLRSNARTDQRAENHVATGAGKTVKVESSHQVKLATKRHKKHKRKNNQIGTFKNKESSIIRDFSLAPFVPFRFSMLFFLSYCLLRGSISLALLF